jgi:hypothetical protein
MSEEGTKIEEKIDGQQAALNERVQKIVEITNARVKMIVEDEMPPLKVAAIAFVDLVGSLQTAITTAMTVATVYMENAAKNPLADVLNMFGGKE